MPDKDLSYLDSIQPDMELVAEYDSLFGETTAQELPLELETSPTLEIDAIEEEKQFALDYLYHAVETPELPSFNREDESYIGAKTTYRKNLDFWKEGVLLAMEEHDPEAFANNREYIERQLEGEVDNVFKTNVGADGLAGNIAMFGKESAKLLTRTSSFIARAIGETQVAVGGLLDTLGFEEAGASKVRAGQGTIKESDFVKEVDDYLDTAIAISPKVEQSFSGQVIGGLGQAVGQVALSAINPSLMLVELVAQGEQASQEAYEETLALTGDKGLAKEAYYKTASAFGVSTVPEAFFFKKLGKIFKGKIPTPKGKLGIATTMLQGGLSEGFQETLETAGSQGAISSTIEKSEQERVALEQNIWSFMKDTWDNTSSPEAIRSGLVGATVGAVAGGSPKIAEKGQEYLDIASRSAVNSIKKVVGRMERGESANPNPDFQIPIENSTPRDLNEANAKIAELNRAIEQNTDPEKIADFKEMLADQQEAKKQIQADLSRQGTTAPNKIEDFLGQAKASLQAELDAINSEVTQAIENNESRPELLKRKKQLELDIKQADDAIASINQEIELDLEDADITAEQIDRGRESLIDDAEVALREERGFFQAEKSKAKKELKDISVRLSGDQKISKAEINKRKKEADNISNEIQKIEGFQGLAEVIEVGETRTAEGDETVTPTKMVATKDLDKDVVDFAGGLLAGFNVDTPVLITSTDLAKNKDFKELIGREELTTRSPRRSGGRDLPTAFTESQKLGNNAILLPFKKLTKENAETVAHEVGHVVFEQITAKNPELRNQLYSEYQQAISKEPNVNKRGSEQKLPLRNEKDKGISSKRQLTFAEWGADQTARYASNKSLEAKSPVERFFKELAESLKEIYNKLIGRTDLQVNKTFQEFLDGYFRDDRFEAFLKNRRGEPASSAEAETAGAKVADERLGSQTLPPTRGKLSSEERQLRNEALAEEGLAEEPLDRETDLLKDGLAEEPLELAEDISQEEYIKATTPYFQDHEKRAKSKFVETNIERGATPDYVRSMLEATGGDYKVSDQALRLDQASDFIAFFGVNKALDFFFDRNLGTDSLDFKTAVGIKLSEIHDALVREFKKQDKRKLARQAREVVFDIMDEMEFQGRNQGSGVSMLRNLWTLGTASGIRHLVQKYARNLAKQNGIEKTYTMSEGTRARIEGLAEEILSAKDNNVESLARAKEMEIANEVASDMESSNYAEGFMEVFYASLLSNPETLGLLSIMGGAQHLVTSSMPNVVAGGISHMAGYNKGLSFGMTVDAMKDYLASVPKGVLDIWAKGLRPKEGEAFDIKRDNEAQIKKTEAQLKKLRDKPNKTLLDHGAYLARSALFNLYTKPLRQVVFRGFNGIDFAFASASGTLRARWLASNEIAKRNPNLSSQEIRAKVREKLYGFNKNGARSYNEAFKKAKADIVQALGEKAKDYSDSEINQLTRSEVFDRVHAQFNDTQQAVIERERATTALKNNPTGGAGAVSAYLEKKFKLSIKDGDSEMTRLLKRSYSAMMLTINKPLANFANNSFDYLPIVNLALNAKKLATGRTTEYEPYTKNDIELDSYDITNTVFALTASNLTAGFLANIIFDEWEDEFDEKSIYITGPRPGKHPTSRETLKPLTIYRYGKPVISLGDTYAVGVIAPLGALFDGIRTGEVKIKSDKSGLTASERAERGIKTSSKGAVAVRDLSKQEQKDVILDNLGWAVTEALLGGTLALVEASPLNNINVITQLASRNTNREGFVEVFAKYASVPISPGYGKALRGVIGGSKVADGGKLYNEGVSFKGEVATQYWAKRLQNSPIAVVFDFGYPLRNLKGEEIKEAFFGQRFIPRDIDDPDFLWMAENGIDVSEELTPIGSGTDKEEKALNPKILTIRELEEKSDLLASNIFSPKEVDTYAKDYLGPYFTKYVAKKRNESRFGGLTSQEIREDFEKGYQQIRRLAKKKMLDDVYGSQLGQKYFTYKDERKLSDLLGD